MSQKFNQKRIAAAVSLAMTAGIAGVAGANEFAATSFNASSTTGVNVPKTSSGGFANLTGLTLNLTSSDGVAMSTGGLGTIVLTLDNGAKFTSAGSIAYSGFPGFAGTVNTKSGIFVSTGAASSTFLVTASGATSLTIPSVTAASSASWSLALSGLSLDTSGSTLDTPVNVTVDSSSTFGGTALTTGAALKIATVKSAGAAATVTGTVPTVIGNSVLTLPAFNVSENIQQSLRGLAKGAIRLTLPSGINFSTASNGTGGAAGNIVTATDSAGGNSIYVSSSATGASNVLVLGAYSSTGTAPTTSSAGAAKFAFDGSTGSLLKAFVPVGQALGDINLTVEATLDPATDVFTSLGTLKVASVASAATSVAAYSAGSATTQYATLYTGRAYTSTISTTNGIPGYTAGVKLTENVVGTLASGGTVTLKVANATATGSGFVTIANVGTNHGLAGTGTTTAADTYTYSVTAPSTTGTGDSLSASLTAFKVLTGTAGKKVQVAVSSTTNVTAATVDIANIADATSASVSGALPSGLAGATVALPDIVITESNAGALVASGALGITAPFASIDSFDASAATIKAYKADGTDVTGTTLIPSSATLAVLAGSTSLVPTATVTLSSSASTTTSGPITLKISGLKAKLGTAGTGDINVSIGGFVSQGATVAATLDPDTGAKAATSVVKVAQFVGNVVSVPAATVSGAVTSQTVTSSILPASSDLGKQGSVFVAAIVPNAGTFLQNSSGSWSLFTSAATAPAYFTGSLSAISSIPVVNAGDLSGLVGTQLYVGYGTGGALSAAGTAWNSMVNNGTYGLSYTITK